MAYGAGTYAEYAKRIKDWMMHAATGANVTDRSLDLANRAQEWLMQYKDWSDLTITAALTVSDNEADFPADFARMVNCNWDSDADGKPEGYFYSNGPLNKGYVIVNTFTKAAGNSRVIKFFNTLGVAPRMTYVYNLDDFTGEDTEYSFFPGNLLLRTAQRLHIEEFGLTTKEMNQIIISQKEMLRDYTQAHHYVNQQLNRRINDAVGNEIIMQDVDLMGGVQGNRDNTQGLDRDVDARYP